MNGLLSLQEGVLYPHAECRKSFGRSGREIQKLDGDLVGRGMRRLLVVPCLEGLGPNRVHPDDPGHCTPQVFRGRKSQLYEHPIFRLAVKLILESQTGSAEIHERVRLSPYPPFSGRISSGDPGRGIFFALSVSQNTISDMDTAVHPRKGTLVGRHHTFCLDPKVKTFHSRNQPLDA
jgi:hypothetical protein